MCPMDAARLLADLAHMGAYSICRAHHWHALRTLTRVRGVYRRKPRKSRNDEFNDNSVTFGSANVQQMRNTNRGRGRGYRRGGHRGGGGRRSGGERTWNDYSYNGGACSTAHLARMLALRIGVDTCACSTRAWPEVRKAIESRLMFRCLWTPSSRFLFRSRFLPAFSREDKRKMCGFLCILAWVPA